MLKPCFLAVDTTDLSSAKIRAPSRVRKPPEIFILTFIIRRSRSARLLVKGTSKSVRKRSVSVLNFFSLSSRLWPGRCLRRPRVFDFVSNAGSRDDMPGPSGPPPNSDRRRPRPARSGAPAFRRPRRAHRLVGLAQHRAHEFGPGFLFKLDQALEFAQDMGVAEGVDDLDEPVVRLEVVVNDDAAFQIPGNVAALFSGAIEGEAKARSRVQPLQLAADPIARLVEMANLLAGDALADPLVDRRQLFRLLAHPGDDARRTDPRRAEYVAHRLRGPILGDQLLDVQIDRRRLEALAILRRRDHAFGNAALVTRRQCSQR